MIQTKSGLWLPENGLECADISCKDCALYTVNGTVPKITDPHGVCLWDEAMQ